MKLFHSPASPYVRKIMVLAHETGQTVETLSSAASPINRDQAIVAKNPTGKVPTALLPDGSALYDSRVICAWLDAQHDGPKMYPEGDALFQTLRREALADGLLDAALLARYETALRPAEKLWPEWLQGQMDKIDSSLNVMDNDVADYSEMDAGWIAVGCAVAYLEFRFPDLDWRAGRDALANWYAETNTRPSFADTVPVG